MSYTQLYYHIVIRPKDNKPALTIEAESELHAYVVGVLRNKNCTCLAINGMPDHLHILLSIPPAIAVSDLIRDLKTATSIYIKQNAKKYPIFEGWGKSFFAATCSKSIIPNVQQYIKKQKEHHQKESFIDEYKRFLTELGIAFTDVYLFE